MLPRIDPLLHSQFTHNRLPITRLRCTERSIVLYLLSLKRLDWIMNGRAEVISAIVIFTLWLLNADNNKSCLSAVLTFFLKNKIKQTKLKQNKNDINTYVPNN